MAALPGVPSSRAPPARCGPRRLTASARRPPSMACRRQAVDRPRAQHDRHRVVQGGRESRCRPDLPVDTATHRPRRSTTGSDRPPRRSPPPSTPLRAQLGSAPPPTEDASATGQAVSVAPNGATGVPADAPMSTVTIQHVDDPPPRAAPPQRRVPEWQRPGAPRRHAEHGGGRRSRSAGHRPLLGSTGQPIKGTVVCGAPPVVPPDTATEAFFPQTRPTQGGPASPPDAAGNTKAVQLVRRATPMLTDRTRSSRLRPFLAQGYSRLRPGR